MPAEFDDESVVPDAQVIETLRKESQEAFDNAIRVMQTGGSLSEMFEAANAPVEVVSLKRGELRFVGTFRLNVPARMAAHAEHYVYRRMSDGQPYGLSREKREALESLGFVHITAFMIDSKRRN